MNWGHDLRAEFTYKADGQFDQIKRFNVASGGTAFVTSDYGHDKAGRLTSLDHRNSSSTSITGYGWTYDTAGRMTSMDFTNSTYNAEDVTQFGYDRSSQLLSGERTGTTNDEAYAYDGTGNRTSANGSSYTTTSNNRLTNDGTFTYTYDDEGNRLTRVRISGAAADDKTVEYTWDYRNRLEKVTFKRNDGTVTKTVELRYDFANRLTQKVVDPDGALGGATLQTDDYFWDGSELVGVYGYNSLVFASGPAPDMVLFESATTLHTLLGDHQNTVRDVLATNGTVENHLAYNSYGELKSQTGGGAYSPFHRFTGKPFDVAVGLQYNINRWYDAATGRWTSEDPIGFGGGHANLHAYTGNSPLNGIDSVGLFPVDPGSGLETRTYHAVHPVGTWLDPLGGGLLGPPISWSFRPPTFAEIEAEIKAEEKAELDRILLENPPLSEPSSEKLAYVGIAMAGGVWGYIKEVGQTILESWLGPAPGPAPIRPRRPNGGGGLIVLDKWYTMTDTPVDLNRSGGTFTTPKNITTPAAANAHFQNVIPWNPDRPPLSPPSFITQITLPPGSLLPDPTGTRLRPGVWLPPGTPGAHISGVWIISEDTFGLFDVIQIR